MTLELAITILKHALMIAAMTWLVVAAYKRDLKDENTGNKKGDK